MSKPRRNSIAEVPSWEQIEAGIKARDREQINIRINPQLYTRIRMIAIKHGYRFPADLIEEALTVGLKAIEDEITQADSEAKKGSKRSAG